MNFNNLPNDIKTLIFSFNRKKQIEIEKKKFKMVISEINVMSQLTYRDYYDIRRTHHNVDYATAFIKAINDLNNHKWFTLCYNNYNHDKIQSYVESLSYIFYYDYN